jgi:uncharacterized protein YndB with AHSA1/START domain
MTAPPFELAVERYIGAPADVVFRVWKQRLEEWWCPKPWTTRLIALELRPGGRSALVMSGPGGESEPMEGVVLDVVPNERIVLTDAFAVGWVPKEPFMVAVFSFAPEGSGTRYRAAARHWDEAACRRHEAMGFTQGWTTVAAQLAAIAEEEARNSSLRGAYGTGQYELGAASTERSYQRNRQRHADADAWQPEGPENPQGG